MKFVPLEAIKAERVEVELQSVLTLTLDEDEWSSSHLE
jgi:hypothetical protein